MTLRRSHVLGAGAFWSVTFGVSHHLSFIQVIKAHALQTFRVEEQVFGAARVDESKSLVRRLDLNDLLREVEPVRDTPDVEVAPRDNGMPGG